MQVVSNTGPLLHLREIGELKLLSHVGILFIPRAVQVEMGYNDPIWLRNRPSWISEHPLIGTAQQEADTWYRAGLLDPGEAEAIALARQLQADWFLTDDSAARVIAQDLKLEVHGSLGIVLWAAARGHLNCTETEDRLDRLNRSSLWLSSRVLAEAKAAVEQFFHQIPPRTETHRHRLDRITTKIHALQRALHAYNLL